MLNNEHAEIVSITRGPRILVSSLFWRLSKEAGADPRRLRLQCVISGGLTQCPQESSRTSKGSKYHKPTCLSQPLTLSSVSSAFFASAVKAVAAMAYLKVTHDACYIGGWLCLWKAKLAPQPDLSIVRLELCAAVLAVEITNMIGQEMDLKLDSIKYNTDIIVQKKKKHPSIPLYLALLHQNTTVHVMPWSHYMTLIWKLLSAISKNCQRMEPASSVAPPSTASIVCCGDSSINVACLSSSD